jgi:SPP1 gp7 family putative phage head morphogenesis protein
MSDDIVSEIDNLSKNRAELIADNEAHKAHARAQEDTMRENGIERYQWLTAGDDRVSPICQSLHRQVFEFGKTGTMNWKDVNGKTYVISKSPTPIRSSHIRCRCVIIAIID